MNEDKATRYHRLGRRAGILSTIWTGVIFLLLLFTGASAGLRDWAGSAAGASPTLTVVLYVLMLSLAFEVVTLPFTVFRGYMLERRYGLSTETLGHWLKDHAKAALIGVVFAEAGAIFVYFALRNWPDVWWAIAGAGYSAVAIALVNLAPIVLLPLFFTFKPLEKAALRDRLTALASKAGTRIMGVYEWTLSDRTKKANAALTGMGNTRRILLSDTLLAEYSDDEIEVILAHELAHHVHKDIWTSVVFDMALTFAGFFAAHLALQRLVPFFGLRGMADPAGIPILLLTAGTIGLCVKPLLNAVSRSHERRADSYALRMTGNPSAFITAMKRLGQQNLAEDSPSKLVQAFFYTHPPIKERLRAAQRVAHMRILLSLMATVMMTACATNPVTGKRELSFMSEAQEISVGKELDAQVRQEMGLYEDDDLQRYVQELGMRLARSSQRPNLPWSFAVLDSPAVNAFALPGGFIYITRGILPYLDNEAQLVGVLGHEIGHVTARHSAQQYTRGMGASLGVLVGSIFVPAVRPVGDLLQGGIGVLFLKFGRDDEIQADALGAAYAAAGGWDPDEVPAFLTTLARIAETTDRNGTPNWLQTHPQPENRAARVGEAVKTVRTPAADTPWTIDRDGYLARIDGLVFGDNPEDGIVRGNLFLHPPLRFALEFPEGWEITNSDEQVVAQEPGNKVFIVLRTIEARPGSSLDQVAQQHMREAGYKATDLRSATVGGLPAVLGTYEGNASGIGRVTARGAHVVLRSSTFFIGGIAPPDLYPRVAGDFDLTIHSFRQMSQDEAEAVKPNLIDLYIARDGDTWQSIAQRAGKGLVSASTLAIMNDHAIDEQPKPGARLKIVVAGS